MAAVPEESRKTLTVEEGTGERLDVYVSSRLQLSRTRVAALIAEGMILVDGERPKKSDPVEGGQEIQIVVPVPEPMSAEPENIPVDIVYEDASLLVVNKRAGMVVHPAPGHPSGTLVNALLHHVDDLSGIGGTLRPGIVHRLDKDTSGLLVVAKNDAAHQGLSEALKRREVRRIYVGAAWGHLKDLPRTIDAPVGRDPRDRKRMAVLDGGRRARTRVRLREWWRAAELLDVALGTGRTHQIRIHLAHLGHPVVGDPIYGAGWERGMGGRDRPWAAELARRVPRLFLHAGELGFDHPETGEAMRFKAPLPPDLAGPREWARDSSLQDQMEP